MSNYPPRLDTRKSIQDQVKDLHRAISQQWDITTKCKNDIAILINDVSKLNKSIVQLTNTVKSIYGHSEVMPDTKGENPDHDRRYQKKIVNPSSEKSGATQILAGAIAGERWITSSHATLPDNVQMMGS